MIRFYDVDTEYADYLRRFDGKVPYIQYGANDKFVCGVVLSINGCDYFAPISSKTDKQALMMKIVDDDGTVLSSIKFNYMFPAPQAVVTQKCFDELRTENPSYANLLQKEYEFCRAHEPEILQKAQKAYAVGCNSKHRLNKVCCNYRLLEDKSKDYFDKLTDEAFAEYDASHDSNKECDGD